MSLPPFGEAEFWNTVLWAPLGQELFTLLKKKARGNRPVFSRVARAAAAKARLAGVEVDEPGLRKLLAEDRLLQPLVARDLAELDETLGSVVQAASEWTAQEARTVLVAALLLAADEELPAERQLDFAAHRALMRKLDNLRSQLGRLDTQSAVWIHLLRGLDARVAGLAEEFGRQARPVGYRDTYGSVIATFERHHLPGLKDRDIELADLAERIGESTGYLAVEAPMYAGKTALFTALRRRLLEGGFAVVVFYIRRGSEDSAAEFLPKVITQLLELLEPYDHRLRDEGIATTLDARRTQFADLWQRAVQTLERPVVLLVDALDEQLSGPYRLGEGSPISQLLPDDVGAQGRVVVSSRLHPNFPEVVPPEHPLAKLPGNRRVSLTPSPHAIASQEKIQRELDHYLASGDPDAEYAAGMYAIATAPLSDDDLADLLDLTPGQVRRLRTPIASSLLRFEDPDGADRFDLGHDAQRRYVRAHLGTRGIGRLTDRVLAWADQYAEHDWPDETPTFLRDHLHTFVLNSARQDRSRRLLGLVTDKRRDLFQRTRHHLDGFLATINAANQTLAGLPPSPDGFADHLWLLLHRIEATTSADVIPNTVLRALVLTGHSSQVLGIAATLPSLAKRADALTTAAAALGEAREFERAGRVAEQALHVAADLDDEWKRAMALLRVATAFVQGGQLDQASQAAAQAQALAVNLDDPGQRAMTFAGVATALARAGQLGKARQAVDEVEKPEQRAVALSRIAAAFARAGQLEQAQQTVEDAQQLATTIDNAGGQAIALAGAATALAQAGQLGQACVAAEQALQKAANLRDAGWQAVVLVRVAIAFAHAGRVNQAREVALQLGDPRRRADALAGIASVLAGANEHERAQQLADEAWRVAADINGSMRQADAFAGVAIALSHAGWDKQARQVAEQSLQVAVEIDDPAWWSDALLRVAKTLVQIDRSEQAWKALERARRAATEIVDPGRRVATLVDAALVLAHSGQLEEARRDAEQAWRSAIDLGGRPQRVEALTRVAVALAHMGQPERAGQVAEQAWETAAEIENQSQRDKALVRVTSGLVQLGLIEQAWRVADTISRPARRVDALVGVATALARVGRPEEAQQVIADVKDPRRRTDALVRTAVSLAQGGRVDQAQQVADLAWQVASGIKHPGRRVDAFVGVAMAFARTGQPEQVQQVMAEIHDPGRQAVVLSRTATSLVEAARIKSAKQIAEQALQVATAIDSPGRRAEVVGQVAIALAQVGLGDQARRLVATIDDPGRRTDELSRVATALAQAGLVDQLQELAATIDRVGWRADALARVASALAQVGLVQQARQVTAGIDQPRRRGEVLARIATAHAAISPEKYLEVTIDVLQDALGLEEVDAQRSFFLEVYVAGLSLFSNPMESLTNKFVA
jgi:tetratricopeptide (TPR) repeat protein